MLDKLADSVSKKDWTSEEVAALVGDARSAHLTYAAAERVRERAASGGSTSALLIHALKSGAIDGAIVCRTVVLEGKVRAEFVLARTEGEILAARGSKYVETRFLRDVLPILRENDGRFAVCGLPCDITNLKRWEERDEVLRERVALRIAFLCGHNSRTPLIDGVTAQLEKEAGNRKLTDFRFRVGHWRGQLEAEFDDGSVVSRPFSTFSNYRNCHFFSERKCMACIDHFGYDSDISFGDVWLYALRKEPVKHTGVLVRTERAQAMLDAAIEDGVLNAAPVPVTTIMDGQSRIAPVHFNLSARARAGRRLGVKLNDPGQKVSLAKYVSAYLTLANMRWSESKKADLIFRLPRPLISAYLYFKKGLEIFR